MDTTELIAAAFSARQMAHAPYSRYRVGAAVLGESGRVHAGCNVENASYGATICAERAAVAAAVAAGERQLLAVAVTGGGEGGEPGFAWPCGVCRQVLREFAAPGMRVLVARTADDVREYTLEQLLPHSFGPDALGEVR